MKAGIIDKLDISEYKVIIARDAACLFKSNLVCKTLLILLDLFLSNLAQPLGMMGICAGRQEYFRYIGYLQVQSGKGISEVQVLAGAGGISSIALRSESSSLYCRS